MNGLSKQSVKPIKTIKAISDVHSQFTELDAIIKNIDIESDEIVVFIGDYLDAFDEGQPKEIIELLLKLSKNPHYTFLLGNHDDFFLETVKGSQSALNTWLINGGKTTLEQLGYSLGNYPISVVSAFLKQNYSEYIEFLEKAKLTYTFENYFFVHAGVNFAYENPLSETPKEELLWIREEYYNHANTTDKIIISGHTPVQLIKNEKEGHYNSSPMNLRIGDGNIKWLIDGGAGDTRIDGKINIVSLFLENDEFDQYYGDSNA